MGVGEIDLKAQGPRLGGRWETASEGAGEASWGM